MNYCFDYDFRCVTEKDFKLFVNMKVNNQMLKLILAGALNRLKKKGKVSKEMKAKKVLQTKRFDCPVRFWNLINTSLQADRYTLYNELEKDFIFIDKDRITKFYFEKEDEFWKAYLIFEGEYSEKPLEVKNVKNKNRVEDGQIEKDNQGVSRIKDPAD